MNIDMIYTWCGEKSSAVGHPQRHRDCSELRYSLRSVYKYAPWINHIYILVNTENMTLPSWLNEESKKWITFVDRCKLFDNKEDTPTYNSFAVHTVIHKIPHLMNHFIVMDDDMFFNNPVLPTYFFDKKTMKPICRIKREPKKIYDKIICPEYPIYKYSTISHQPLSFRIDYIHLFHKKYPNYYKFIQSHKYRYKKLSEYLLFIYYEDALDLILVDTTLKSFLQIPHVHQIDILPEFQQIYHILKRYPHFIVFNCNDDFSLHPIHFTKQLSVLKTFYEKLYPDIPPFETGGDLFKKKIVIAGCAQTIAPYIPHIFKNIYMITKLFKEYKIIIFENDSTDKTLELLFEYSKKDTNCILLSEKNIPVPFRLHAHRIAYGRNKLLVKIRHSFGDYDYMVMMDMDDVCSSLLQIQHFKNIFKNLKWDAVSFNTLPYYDIWALRYPPFYHNFRNLSNKPTLYTYYVDCLKKDIAKQLKNKSILLVLSAFGGFAIYKIPKIKNCWYDARNRDTSISRIYYAEDCEHVAFHRQMKEKNNAHIFISSSILFPSSPKQKVPHKVPPRRRNLMSRLLSHK